ncbi:MAG TPA: hypothetical protein VGR92_06075 [Steroidobacteraceae bacterium]|nr:hypothetical protein [Steroidobacteraceae bacterium]
MSTLEEARTAYELAKRGFERAQVDCEERLARLAENSVAVPPDLRERLAEAEQARGAPWYTLALACLRIALDEHPEIFHPESIN